MSGKTKPPLVDETYQRGLTAMEAPHALRLLRLVGV